MYQVTIVSRWLTQSPLDDSDDLWCKVCKTKVKNKKYNAEMHAKSQKLQTAADQIKGSLSISSFFTGGLREMKIFDIRRSVAIACHAAIRATDHLGEIINKSSRKTDFLNGMKHHRTKCSNILTNVVHPCLHDSVIKDIQQTSFSLIIDESTDVSVTKHWCLCVRYFKEDIPSVVKKNLNITSCHLMYSIISFLRHQVIL